MTVWRASAAVAAAAILLPATGCGGGSGSTSTAAAVPKLSPADVQTLLRYSGGTAGRADPRRSPVHMGYVNQEGGADGHPDFNPEATAAVGVLNDQLGGIDGHPVRLVKCLVASADDAHACGERFADDPRIKIILQYALDIGSVRFHAAVDAEQIPITGALPAGFADVLDHQAFYSNGGVFATVPAFVKYAHDYLHARNIALINVQGEPASTSIARLMKQSFEQAGMNVGQSSFSVGASNVTGPLATAGAQTADAIVPLVLTAPQCLGMADALRALRITTTPVMALYGCVGPSLEKRSGDYPKWTYATSFQNVLAPTDNPTSKAAIAAYDDFSKGLAPAVAGDPSGVVGLQTVLGGARLVNDGGGADATRASIVAAGRRFKGPFLLGPPDVKYGAIPGLPAIPGLGTRFYTYDGNGTWTDPTHGVWVVGTLGS